jgi:putative ABC transport system permease protein
MQLLDQLRSVRHTFDANRGRTALTLLGIMIGAGSLVLLASLLSGGKEQLQMRSQDADEDDVIQVNADDAPIAKKEKTQRGLGRGDEELLTDAPLLPGAQVTGEKDRWTIAYHHKLKKRIAAVGAQPRALSLYRLEMGEGRFISDDDLRDGRRIAVVGVNVARDLFPAESALGGEITIDGAQWTVVGVLKTKPGFGGQDGPWMWNSKVLVPRTTFDAIFDAQHLVDEVFVRLSDGKAPLPLRVQAARAAITSTLLRRHYGVDNFKVDERKEGEQQFNVINEVIEMLLIGTALLSLFVGGINIMNIMLVTVTERTREIGIRRAIGANPTSIMMQFLLEAAFIALTGGVIGVVGGMGLAWAISAVLTRLLGSWTLQVQLWSVALGLGLSLVTGIVFGIFPAWRAARLDPVEALRYE